MLHLDNAFYLGQKIKMPLWVRFIISAAGAALTVVTVTALTQLELVTVVDHLHTFFGLWLGPVSIFGAIIGYWVQPSSLASASD